MNKQRRNELIKLMNLLYNVKNSIVNNGTSSEIVEQLKSIIIELESVKWDEEYYMDNIPENLQGGYRYQVAEDACDNLENAIDCLNEAIDDVNSNEMLIYINKSINFINEARV